MLHDPMTFINEIVPLCALFLPQLSFIKANTSERIIFPQYLGTDNNNNCSSSRNNNSNNYSNNNQRDNNDKSAARSLINAIFW